MCVSAFQATQIGLSSSLSSAWPRCWPRAREVTAGSWGLVLVQRLLVMNLDCVPPAATPPSQGPVCKHVAWAQGAKLVFSKAAEISPTSLPGTADFVYPQWACPRGESSERGLDEVCLPLGEFPKVPTGSLPPRAWGPVKTPKVTPSLPSSGSVPSGVPGNPLLGQGLGPVWPFPKAPGLPWLHLEQT